jgi:hypothetical protein
MDQVLPSNPVKVGAAGRSWGVLYFVEDLSPAWHLAVSSGGVADTCHQGNHFFGQRLVDQTLDLKSSRNSREFPSSVHQFLMVALQVGCYGRTGHTSSIRCSGRL